MRQERRLPTPSRPRRPGGGSGPRARRRAIHASEVGANERPPEVAHNASVLIAQTEAVDCAIHAESIVSRFLPCWGDRPTRFDVDYVDSVVLGVIDELEADGSWPALVALRALAALAEQTVAIEAADAAELVAASGVAAPAWASQIGQAEAVAARISRNDEDDSAGVLVEYAYPDGERHVLAAFIADDMGGAVKFMGLTTPLDDAADDSELPLEALPPADAEQLIREALEATDQAHARFEGDPSMREFGALAWSRVR
jgi:hypothetical protein